MHDRETASEIDADAAAWAIRLAESGGELRSLPGLEDWLAGDSRRAGALLRAQAILEYMDRGRALAGAPALAPQSAVGQRRLDRRTLITGATIAALGSAAGVALFLRSRGAAPAPLVFRTALGEMLRVPLPDGTIALLNTATELAVSFSPRLRRTELLQGQVWFDVAGDAERPFLVVSGSTLVRAIGTEFAVWRRRLGTEVLVNEGTVQARPGGPDLAATTIGADTRAFLPIRGVARLIPLNAADVSRLLAWREGQIVLDGETVAAAATEFNRYNSQKIEVDDRALAGETLVGRFHTNQPVEFAQAVAEAFGARVEVHGPAIRLYRNAT